MRPYHTKWLICIRAINKSETCKNGGLFSFSFYSERELTFMFTICSPRPSAVCRLSVALVRATQAA